MDTDAIFFRLFSQHPAWLRELTGLPIPEECKASAPVFKQTEVRCDLLLEPDNPADSFYLIEFQLYYDCSIFNRVELGRQLLWRQLNAKEDCRRRDFAPREVEAVIIFGDRDDLPGNSARYPVTEILFLDEMIQSLAEREPDSPLVASLVPLWENAEDVLERDAPRHYDLIRNAKGLSNTDREILVEIFVNLLLQRFKTKSFEEIQAMIAELTPLKETRAGAELFEEGIEKGIERGVEKERLSLVRALYESGMTPEEIARAARLEEREVRKLLSTDS